MNITNFGFECGNADKKTPNEEIYIKERRESRLNHPKGNLAVNI